jgi:hypothetical protein
MSHLSRDGAVLASEDIQDRHAMHRSNRNLLPLYCPYSN